MGFSIHITRAESWPGSASAPISSDEWKAIVAAAPELNLDEGGLSAEWTAHPEPLEAPTFDWSDAHISVARPDDATLDKALELANRLRARVNRR